MHIRESLVSRSSRLDPRDSRLDTRDSILERFEHRGSRIESRGSSFECQLTFERYCNLLWAVLYYQHEINMSHFLSSSSSHTQASKSRWFVGSSSNRSVGLTNRARAKAILIRQPPEKSFVFVCCMEGVKPRPSRISAALVSALSASRSSSLSKISNNLKEI